MNPNQKNLNLEPVLKSRKETDVNTSFMTAASTKRYDKNPPKLVSATLT
jgi:hypothetical protein